MLPSAPPDLSGVPKQYHYLCEVFSKEKALSLPPTGPMTVPSSYCIPLLPVGMPGEGGHGTVHHSVTGVPSGEDYPTVLFTSWGGDLLRGEEQVSLALHQQSGLKQRHPLFVILFSLNAKYIMLDIASREKSGIIGCYS